MRTKTKALNFAILMALLLLSALSSNARPNEEKTGKNDNMNAFEVITGMGGDFELTNHHGVKTHLKDFRGKVVLLFFGYTNCPIVCPTTLADLSQLMGRMGKNADNIQVLFITADPERDTAERLNEYVPYFHPSFLGLTGTVGEITKVAVQYGAGFKKIGYKSADEYEISHSTYIYLLDQKGKFYELYPFKTPVDRIAADIRKLFAADKTSLK